MRYTATACLLTLGIAASAAYVPQARSADDADTLYSGWKVLRQFDCARCHGATYEGSVGPSLVKSAAGHSEAEFTQLLLDGNIERGMPAFREVAPVADSAQAIYAYFKARADGRIGAEKLSPSGENTDEKKADQPPANP